VRQTQKRAESYAPRKRERRGGRCAVRKVQSRQVYAARRRKAAGVALASGLVLAFVFLVNSAFGGSEIRSGVKIGELEVGGMTREEAHAYLGRHASTALDEVELGDEGFSVTGEELGVKVDAASAVEKAYSVGREGGVFGTFFGTLRSYLGGVQVDAEVGYDKEAARVAIENLSREFYRKPQNATFRVSDSGKVEIQEARDGRVLDQEATLANLDGALTDLSDEVALVSDSREPVVSTREVEKLRPTEVIGEYRTDFKWDSNPTRQANMKLAAGAVNNTVLAPSEEFSFNELTSDLDYGQAKTFSEGGVAYADGGGLCQVSSTLYMAAQYAGMEVVERHPHFAVLPYIKPGFDATVWFGGDGIPELDMKLKNNTGAYVVVREYVDEKGFLNAEILGQPTGKQVEMRSEKVFEDPMRGIKWATYKKVTRDGEVLFDGLIHDYVYGYNPPAPEGGPHYETSAPRVAGWNDPTNTTGWAEVE
jgi:vancomycin resistance protein YoaR